MNPLARPHTRPQPVEHTLEDQAIWSDVVFRLGGRCVGSVLWTRSLMQDTYDATLMWRAQVWPVESLWLGSTLWVAVRGVHA